MPAVESIEREGELAPSRTGDQSSLPGRGQRHDRLVGNDGKVIAMKSIDTEDAADEPEISTSQRMLSATSGSLLTSILGKKLHTPACRSALYSLMLTSYVQSHPLTSSESVYSHNHRHPL